MKVMNDLLRIKSLGLARRLGMRMSLALKQEIIL
jgi:hypothetical protein